MPNRSRVVFLALAVLTACGGGSTVPTSPPPPPPPTPVATVAVAPGSATLLPAQTTQLAATTKDASGNQLNGRAVTWSSSNAAAATVDNNGLVTAVAAGAATISATSEGKAGSAEVTVLAPVASVAVAPNAPTVLAGGTVALTATLKDAAGIPLSGRIVTWTTSAPAAATVDGSGLVTAVAAGTATITATAEGKSGTAQVTVLAPVASVAVTPGTASLLVGATVALTGTPKDAGNNALTGRTVAWASTDVSIATVSGVGLVTAVGPGTATITATAEGKSGTALVTVLAPVASVVVAPGTASAVVGNTVALTASLRDAANNPLTGRTIVWNSGSPNVATVDANGLVTTVSSGTAMISAISEGKSGSAQVTALAPIAAVTLSGNFGPKVGDSYSYTPTLRLANGSVVVRPYVFSIQEVGKGTMTPDGTLVPLQTGTITLVVTVDGTAWTTAAVAYDWQDRSSGGALRVALRSDATITNKFGTSERPDLIISCTASGYLFVYVAFNNFVTANGLVAYNFDGGGSIVATWDELGPSYDSLWHPGLTNVQRRAFAGLLATARRWAFAFTEFNSTAKGMLFRVTGLAPLVAPIIAACPSNSQVVDGTAFDLDRQEVMRLTGGTGPVATDVQGRAQGGPQMMRAPVMSGLVGPDVETRVMVRGR